MSEHQYTRVFENGQTDTDEKLLREECAAAYPGAHFTVRSDGTSLKVIASPDLSSTAALDAVVAAHKAAHTP